MSDGWNHAGRSVKTGEPGVLGSEWRRASDHPSAPSSPLIRGTDLGPNIPLQEGGQQWLEVSLVFWDGQQK